LTLGGGTSGSTNTDYIVCAGLVTSSRSEMVFSIVLPHTLTDVSSVSITSSKVYVRQVSGGYILQGTDLVTASTSINIGISAENTITVSAVKTGGWVDNTIPNNSPIVVEGGFNLSFS
jgi:hypothetical protein